MAFRTAHILIVIGLVAATQLIAQSRATQPRTTPSSPTYEPRVVDRTSSLGKLLPDGTEQAQTEAIVGPGQVSAASRPACFGSGIKAAGSNCVKVCVRMPLGSTLTKVEGFAQEIRTIPWLVCDAHYCIGRPVAESKAMFDAAGYIQDRVV